RLDPARAYVEAECLRRPSEERHIKSLSPLWLNSIGRWVPGGPIFSHLLDSGARWTAAPRPCLSDKQRFRVVPGPEGGRFTGRSSCKSSRIAAGARVERGPGTPCCIE